MALPVTFTGADNDLISTIGFTRFSGDTGTVVISDNNACRPGSTASSVYYYYDTDIPSSADYDVQIDFAFKSNGKTQRFGIIGRGATDAKTFYLARINFVAFAATANLQLFKAVAGTFTQLGSNYSFSVTASTTGVIKLSMSGSTIKAFLDGVERISVTDTAITASGRAGIYNTADDAITNTTGFHFDNLNGTFASAGGITATLAATEANDTLVSAAALPITATAASTEANDTLVSAASLAISATLSLTEANDTLTSAASLPISATLASTEADDTLVSEADLVGPVSASLAVTEGNDTCISAASITQPVVESSGGTQRERRTQQLSREEVLQINKQVMELVFDEFRRLAA